MRHSFVVLVEGPDDVVLVEGPDDAEVFRHICKAHLLFASDRNKVLDAVGFVREKGGQAGLFDILPGVLG